MHKILFYLLVCKSEKLGLTSSFLSKGTENTYPSRTAFISPVYSDSVEALLCL